MLKRNDDVCGADEKDEKGTYIVVAFVPGFDTGMHKSIRSKSGNPVEFCYKIRGYH